VHIGGDVHVHDWEHRVPGVHDVPGCRLDVYHVHECGVCDASPYSAPNASSNASADAPAYAKSNASADAPAYASTDATPDAPAYAHSNASADAPADAPAYARSNSGTIVVVV
jgi:cell wall-associated NlpC family hydrolase